MIVITIGTWDLPHLGHYHLFRQIKTLFPQSTLVVGVNTDEFILEYKGKLPSFSYEKRAELIGLIDLVDEVVPNIGGADSKPAILKANADVVAIGSDWLRKDYLKQMDFTPEWLEENRITLVYIPRYIDISTTMIKSTVNGD